MQSVAGNTLIARGCNELLNHFVSWYVWLKYCSDVLVTFAHGTLLAADRVGAMCGVVSAAAAATEAQAEEM
jgi:hypothetical protein